MFKFHKNPYIYPVEVVLKVKNIDISIEFYKTIMGFNMLDRKDKEARLTVDEVNSIVTLIQPDNITPKPPRRTGLYHFALLLPSRTDLGLFLKNIRDKNYPIIGGSNHGVSEAIYLEDPDDNGIEVYADRPEITWDRTMNSINMITEMLDYNELIDIAGDRKWEGAPRDSIIGHMHLHVRDLDEALEFYKAFGFELVMAMRNQAYFVSTGGYHHHIGFNIWNGKGAEPLPYDSVGMKYFTIKFPDENIKREKIDNLNKGGYELIKEESGIYIEDPSKNLIKLI